MTVLVLRLAGPMQAWGSSSRFVRRSTEPHPTKSGVLGLFAAALGRRRVDPIEDLLGLRFGVRIDQPGRLLRDFQTARSLDGSKAMPLSYRYYLSDAVFLAVVEGEQALLGTLRDALARPAFPLYLGRRSCPPAGPLLGVMQDGSLWESLATRPWAASAWHRRRLSGPVRLEVVLDAAAAPEIARRSGDVVTLRDAPISFDPTRREYGWREVVRTWVELENRGSTDVRHDPLAITGG